MNALRPVVAILLLTMFTTSSLAQQRFLGAHVNAENVPGGSDSTATARARFTVNLAGDKVRYEMDSTGFDLDGQQTPTNSDDDVTTVDLHRAPVGSTGPVVFKIFGSNADNDLMVDPATGALSGVWDNLDGFLLSDSFPSLAAGDVYLDVHTKGAPDGEIRGQVMVYPAVIIRVAKGDLQGIGAAFVEAHENPGTQYIIELVYAQGDPDPLAWNRSFVPAPFLGNLQFKAVMGGSPCSRGKCRVKPDNVCTGTKSSIEIEAGGSVSFWNVDVGANPCGPFVDVGSGGGFDTWDSNFRSEGKAPVIRNRGGNVMFVHSLITGGCSEGSSWPFGQTKGTTVWWNSAGIHLEGCPNNILDLSDSDAEFFSSHVGRLNFTGEITNRNNIIADGPFSGVSEIPLVNTAAVKKANRAQKAPPRANSTKSLCHDFGIGTFISLGFNVDTDGSCALDQPTDLPNTDPMIVFDANGIPQPQPGSPLIESGPVNFTNNVLPCMYKDLNNLGRPQDFDLDGVFTCDRGPVEIQGGPDIGAPQTAAYFAANRSGEGAFVEILTGGRAIISFYTYSPDGLALAWLVGLGRVVGNSVVVDEMQRVTGGVFGAGFDPAKIVRTNVGGMSMVFPDCAANTHPGRLNFTAESTSGLEHLLQSASRLTFVVNCDGTKAVNADRSGAFFARARSGEGIFVQWLSDGRVVLVFYTFDANGNPFWTISDVDNTVVNGNTVTANMLYAEGKTRYGAKFNPAEVKLAPWGTTTLTYTGDKSLNFAYNSVVAGFGAGNHDYVRLTQPLGTKAVAQGN